MISRVVFAAGFSAVVAQKGSCDAELGALQQQLAAMEERAIKAEAALARQSCPPCADTLTWTGFTSFLKDTFSLQKAMVGSVYGAVVTPAREEFCYAQLENAKSFSVDKFDLAKDKVGDLYDQHLEQHYSKHLGPHVNKITTVVGDQVENIQNLYTLHGESHVENAKVTYTKVLDGFGVGWEKLSSAVSSGSDQVDAFLGPKVEVLIQLFPEHANVVPDGLHDRIFFILAFIALTILYAFVIVKLSGKALCFSKCAVSKVFGIVFAIAMFPLRVLTCQVCKKRSPAKQTFSEPPNSNGSNKKNKKHK